MECAKAKSLLLQKIDGELPDEATGELRAHLAQCPSCAREYGLLSLPRRMGRYTPSWTASPYFYQKLRLHIEEEESRNVAGWQLIWRLAGRMLPALAGITLALLAILAYYQLRGPETDVYRAYERVFASEDQSHRILVADQGDITAISVLRAIADQEPSHHDSELK